MHKEVIISTSGKGINLKSSQEFLNWYFKEKPFDKNIVFDGDEIEVGRMEALYSFLKYYNNVSEKCSREIDLNNNLYVMENNRFVKEAMEQFVISNSGGKNLRGVLCGLGYHSFGGTDDRFLPLSTAIEVFQTSILIHDDIIDKADLRRGIDTIPIRYEKIYSDALVKKEHFKKKRKDVSNSMTLCIGDLGLYLANKILLKHYKDKEFFKIFDYYNDMVIKTCKGEMIDVALPFYEEFYGMDDLESSVLEIYKLKTSWYSVVGPYVLGAILAGVSDKDVEKLEDSLMNLGIAFQIKDDLFGVFGDEKKIGKSVISDVTEYKQTILYAYAINTSYKDDLLELYGKENLSLEEFEKIKDIFKKSGAEEYSNKLMDKLFKESFDDILSLDIINTKYKKILLGFAEFLRVRNR